MNSFKYLKPVLGFLLSVLAGVLGSFFFSQRGVLASSGSVLKASRFELLNPDGVPIALLSSERSGTLLRFLPVGSNPILELGVSTDGKPFLRLLGKDKIERVNLSLDQNDKPYLIMSDDKWQGRMSLGMLGPDTIPGPDGWDEWGLHFRGVGSERPLAGIGITKIQRERLEGYVTISGKQIR